MSSRQYLLIDSTYRDRNLYPNPADFIIPFQRINPNTYHSDNVLNTSNPLTYAYPVYCFCWTNLSATDLSTFQGTITGGTPQEPVVDASIDVLIGLDCTNPQVYSSLVEAMDVFKNLIFIEDSTGTERLIVGYDPIFRRFTLEYALPPLSIPTTYSLRNPSTREKIILMGSLDKETSDLRFLNREVYLMDLETEELVSVLSIQQNQLFLARPFGSQWKVTDPYFLFNLQPPLNYGQLEKKNGRFFSSQSIIRLEVESSGEGYTSGVYSIGNPSEHDPVSQIFVRTTSDSKVRDVEVLTPGSGYQIGKTYPIQSSGGGGTITTATVRILQTGTSFYASFRGGPFMDYSGQYFFLPILSLYYSSQCPTSGGLRISPNGSIPIRSTRNIPVDLFQAQTQNGVTPILRVFISKTDPEQGYILTQNLTQENYQILQEAASLVPEDLYYHTFQNCMVLGFTKEGVEPLNFVGTQVQSMSCYELCVNTLILPNTIVNDSNGTLTSDFPYVFLEISNETAASGHNRSVIYSNNPEAVNATFVCSISDVNNPNTTRFIKISSDSTVQTIKFKPNDNLRFRISLPNGATFSTQTTDYMVPIRPNNALQINALISIQRLN